MNQIRAHVKKKMILENRPLLPDKLLLWYSLEWKGPEAK